MNFLTSSIVDLRSGQYLQVTVTIPIPSATCVNYSHVFFVLALLGLWKAPLVVQAFDPFRSSFPSSKSSRQSSTPPRLSKADSESFSDSVESLDDSSLTSSEDQRFELCDDEGASEPSTFLKKQVPESTKEERQRFLLSQGGDQERALEKLNNYLSWRTIYEITQQELESFYDSNKDDEENDLYDWTVASQTALRFNNEAPDESKVLPRLIRTFELSGGEACDHDDCRIVHLRPAQIDDHICNLSTYSLAIILYFDRKLSRQSAEKLSIFIDMRPGKGWRNMPAICLLPFIKDTIHELLDLFPERLQNCVLYPLPFALTWILNGIKKIMDPKTANKIHVLSGSAGLESPVPLKQLTEHMSEDVVLICERERLSTFNA